MGFYSESKKTSTGFFARISESQIALATLAKQFQQLQGLLEQQEGLLLEYKD